MKTCAVFLSMAGTSFDFEYFSSSVIIYEIVLKSMSLKTGFCVDFRLKEQSKKVFLLKVI